MCVATAAGRDANERRRISSRAAEQHLPARRSTLLSGTREAELSALGVISGIYKPDGIVGDLGGGSLELIDVKRPQLGKGVTLPLGGLALMDASDARRKQAAKIVREALGDAQALLERGAGPHFLRGRRHLAGAGAAAHAAARLSAERDARLCRSRRATPPISPAWSSASTPRRSSRSTSVTAARRPLLAYGAVVLERSSASTKPREIVISALGVREGLLYELLDDASARKDPLIAAAARFNVLRSRAPEHGEELFDWTDAS